MLELVERFLSSFRLMHLVSQKIGVGNGHLGAERSYGFGEGGNASKQ